MTDQELLDYLLPSLPIWKERLGLQHWETHLKIVRREQIDGNVGQCIYQDRCLYATISVISPMDWTETQDQYDAESTMVHELIHLLVYQLSPDQSTHEYVIMEQAITRLERALVQAYIKKPSPP